jgi:hypothetical protein
LFPPTFRGREHSRKPDEAFTRVGRFCPGPRVELFAHEARDGWDTWGDQVGMFNEPILAPADNILELATGPKGPTGATAHPLPATGLNLEPGPYSVPAPQDLHSFRVDDCSMNLADCAATDAHLVARG